MISGKELLKLRRGFDQSLRLLTQQALYRAKIASVLRAKMPRASGLMNKSYTPRRDDFESYKKSLFTSVQVSNLGIPTEAESIFYITPTDDQVKGRHQFQGDPIEYSLVQRGKKYKGGSKKKFDVKSILFWMRLKIRNGGNFNKRKKGRNTGESVTEAGVTTAMKGIRKRRSNEYKRRYADKMREARKALHVASSIVYSIRTKKRFKNQPKDFELQARLQAGKALKQAMRKWETRTYEKVVSVIEDEIIETTTKLMK